jgi:hypothetical protein
MSRSIRSCCLSATVIACTVLGACGAESSGEKEAAPQTVTLTADDAGTSVNAATKERIDVMLQTIGPGEYSMPSISSDNVQFVDVTSPGAPNPGGVKQDFRFEVEAAGTATITIPHSEGREPFEVTIVVQ